MTPGRALRWTGAGLLAPLVLAAVLIAVFGWNWLRGPIERQVLTRTGRALTIAGDLTLKAHWPLPSVVAGSVSFANPGWAHEKMMLAADSAEITLDLPALWQGRIAMPLVLLEHPVVFLEQGSGGRKSWLLDLQQQDETARIRIDRLMLDQGRLGYDDAARKTSIRADVSTAMTRPDEAQGSNVSFHAHGQYLGLPLKADGSGGPVFSIRDETTPYPITVTASVGKTEVRANGHVTSLLKFVSLDMQLALQGESLDQLFPLLGIALPPSHAYVTSGHLMHHDGEWRYEKFVGRVGVSDIAGNILVKTGGPRLSMQADLTSSVLDMVDLGPMMGMRPGSVATAKADVTGAARVLPELPFTTERWGSLDAEVSLKALAIRRTGDLPLDKLNVHLSLHDKVLRLDPLDFGIAAGHLSGKLSLDGRSNPILGHAQLQANQIQLARLLPKLSLGQTNLGRIHGSLDLQGKGNSVGAMLAHADGRANLVIADGQVSQLMMEKAGLHLWEMLQLSLSGDRLIHLRCALADFEVKQGRMNIGALVFDTSVTTIEGTGNINLANESLDITLNQKTKNTSPLALTAPIHIAGSLAHPVAQVDKGRVALRALGAIALGLVNPLLALVPLVDAGPGQDSDCGKLMREARGNHPVTPASAAAGK
jgi:AsmA protein